MPYTRLTVARLSEWANHPETKPYVVSANAGSVEPPDKIVFSIQGDVSTPDGQKELSSRFDSYLASYGLTRAQLDNPDDILLLIPPLPHRG